MEFLLRSIYGAVNMSWGLTGKLANLKHVLPSCNKQLAEGRYWWRHDNVISEVAAAAAAADVARRKKGTGRQKVQFS